MNNAFRYDDTRSHSVGEEVNIFLSAVLCCTCTSLATLTYDTMMYITGLGGNISRSVGNVSALARSNHPIPHHYEAHTEDAGNGSLMRLAPVVLRYHTDIALAREQAYTSSLTTHPGPIAAEACAFLAHLLVRGIHRPTAHHCTTVSQHLCGRVYYLAGCRTGGRISSIKIEFLFSEAYSPSVARGW